MVGHGIPDPRLLLDGPQDEQLVASVLKKQIRAKNMSSDFGNSTGDFLPCSPRCLAFESEAWTNHEGFANFPVKENIYKYIYTKYTSLTLYVLMTEDCKPCPTWVHCGSTWLRHRTSCRTSAAARTHASTRDSSSRFLVLFWRVRRPPPCDPCSSMSSLS